jgi:hypothetical protein
MHRVPRSLTRIGLPLAIVTVTAAALLALSARPSDAETHTRMQMPMSSTGSVTHHQLVFRNRMRVLWEQHVAWTRMAIVSFDGGLPDLAATERRLLRNQGDIGDAIAPFYGRAAGDQMTALLRRHILIAVAILGDAKNGDQTALDADLARWTRNANQIAAFLHAANPDNWSLADMRSMMHAHLRLTTAEALAELNGDYAGSVSAYDRVEQEILGMSDMLSTGIIRQFPDRFA